ncbi:MAG: hypothetical protein HY011_30340 [Acidobacteria bacterium]|nr:hypothetical protein [Acidobacteriota bacterium]
MGDHAKASAYARRIVSELGGTAYVTRAQGLLDNQPLPQPNRNVPSCIGCHAH